MLERTELLDSPPEVAFDRLTQLALRLTDAAVSFVSLVTDDRQFFKSTAGLPEELSAIRSTPLSHSFCQHAVASGEDLVANDTVAHSIVNKVQAIQDFGVRSYLGIPLQTPSNHTLGTLCVLGFETHTWQNHDIQTMHYLASIAMTEVALRLELRTQQELQADIREREARYRSVLEGIHEVVFKVDHRGNISFVNPAWEALMGYKVQHTIGRPIGEFLPRDEVFGRPLEALHAHAASQKTYTTHFLSKNGEMKWLEIRVKYQSHNNANLVGVITNVTNDYRIEAEREAREEAERHLRLKDALLSNISHEIRTPLAAIMSCSEILHEEVDVEQQDFTTMIKEGGERLLTTLDSMLLYAQVQSNNIIAEYTRFNLVKAVEKLVSTFNAKHVTISIDGDPSIVMQSDQALVTTILRNLLVNAIKFTSEGQITVKLFASDEEVEIEVADTGIGIPQDYIPRLFTLFEQASAGYNRSYEGCGLGLPLVKLLIDFLGGTIKVKSTERVGTTFLVSIPKTVHA